MHSAFPLSFALRAVTTTGVFFTQLAFCLWLSPILPHPSPPWSAQCPVWEPPDLHHRAIAQISEQQLTLCVCICACILLILSREASIGKKHQSFEFLVHCFLSPAFFIRAKHTQRKVSHFDHCAVYSSVVFGTFILTHSHPHHPPPGLGCSGRTVTLSPLNNNYSFRTSLGPWQPPSTSCLYEFHASRDCIREFI